MHCSCYLLDITRDDMLLLYLGLARMVSSSLLEIVSFSPSVVSTALMDVFTRSLPAVVAYLLVCCKVSILLCEDKNTTRQLGIRYISGWLFNLLLKNRGGWIVQPSIVEPMKHISSSKNKLHIIKYVPTWDTE